MSDLSETARERDELRAKCRVLESRVDLWIDVAQKAEARCGELLGAAKVALVCIETLMEGTGYTEQSFAAPSMLRDAIAGAAS